MRLVEKMVRIERMIQWERAVRECGPSCPNCGEERRLQLRDMLDHGGPLWKCRACRHKFHTAKPNHVPEP